ncbi:hypothetical protein OUZ56_015122 [Daphnia magna]|uniref:Uncharacterized protein n=1 Tax=Daphnia magna TaxID=35525 RepID=A0ABR0ALV0_9CRUS|nr:hypothetical protein OUZ56_015122 [Daphnia magna]
MFNCTRNNKKFWDLSSGLQPRYHHNNFADGLDFGVQFLSLILTKLKSTRKRRRLSLILLVSLTKKEISAFCIKIGGNENRKTGGNEPAARGKGLTWVFCNYN